MIPKPFHESLVFIKHLDEYLFEASEYSANYLSLNKGKIPSMLRVYSQKLYRGTFLSDKEYDDLTNNKFRLTKPTSWTKDERIALKFVNDSKYVIQKNKPHKVMFCKTISSSNIILDIDKFAHAYMESKLIELGLDDMNIDSAMKEKEVLVASVSITNKEFKDV